MPSAAVREAEKAVVVAVVVVAEGGGGDGGLGGGCGGRPGGGVSCEKPRKILEDALLAWKDSCVVEPIAHIMLVGSMFGSNDDLIARPLELVLIETLVEAERARRHSPGQTMCARVSANCAREA